MAKLHKVLIKAVLHPLRSLNLLERAVLKTGPVSRLVTRLFHKLYYGSEPRTWGDTRWFGVPVLKCPLDLWIYQEIFHQVRPDLVIECGTASGGSTLYFAGLMDLLGKGRIISIDLNDNGHCPRHPRISYVQGSSTDPEVVRGVEAAIRPGETVLAVLDSDHSKAHVLAELRAYARLVTPGSYMVVEDSNQNGHPVSPFYGPGPMEAIEAFLAENRDFAGDATREKFFLTFNPRGYLRRLS